MLINLDTIINKHNITITGVIHVGGNVGEEVSFYRKYTNRIHVFEPRVDAFNKIPEDVNKYNVALGNRDGDVKMFLASNGQSSSCLEPKLHLQSHPSITFNENTTVPIRTLDSFAIEGCSLLNMDTQGYELEVLKGAEETLKGINTVYTEVNTRELYRNCVLLQDLDRWLSERGFARVETSIYEHLGWGDALYMKRGR